MMNEDDRKLLGVIAYLVASTAHIIAEESNISRTHKKRLADNVDDLSLIHI